MQKPRAFLYCRVVHDDGFSLENQHTILRDYADQAGYTIIGASADKCNGLTLDRLGLQRVTQAVLAGKVDVVLAKSFCRIGRETRMVQEYIDLLAQHNVELLCIKEHIQFQSLPDIRWSDFEGIMGQWHKAVLYCRAACDDGSTLEIQERKLRHYAFQTGYTVIDVLREVGSGRTMDRPALKRVNHLIREGKVDTVIVVDIGRVSRNFLMVNDYINFLRKYDTKLICVNDDIIFS